jgi:hypothetical protein
MRTAIMAGRNTTIDRSVEPLGEGILNANAEVGIRPTSVGAAEDRDREIGITKGRRPKALAEIWRILRDSSQPWNRRLDRGREALSCVCRPLTNGDSK